ncbi:zinc-ribbon domain-containing protein [Bacteriovoracaceae bacterium]|nr:zinc-ribbon domain-containing protein [Bacteriovoracaceae bacterium]
MRRDSYPNKKLTKEIVNNRLASRNISLEGDYTNHSTPTSFKCSKGHTWDSRPTNVLSGTGCPYCSGNKLDKNNSLGKLNTQLAKEWHSFKNGSLTPFDVSPNSGKKVWWKCPKDKNHEWKAVIQSRSQGCGCPYCSGRMPDKNNNLEKSSPELIKEWHSELNGELNPNRFTPRSGRVVWWKCSKGEDHEWRSSIVNRVKGNGCPICSGRKAVNSNCLATLNPNLIGEWCKVRNIKLSPYDVTPGSNKRVWWKCSKGEDHVWKASVADRAAGSMCPICANRKIVKSNCLATLRPDLLNEWHPTKNGKRTPYNVHPGSGFRVWWKCIFGHEWKTAIYHRGIQNHGCNACSNKTSIPELRILAELKIIFPTIQHRVVITGYEVDLYIPEINLAIEYDGVYWHKDKVEADRKKNKTLESELTLIRVREKGLDKIRKHDILLEKTEISHNDIKKILKLIVFRLNASTLLNLERINKYLNSAEWNASKYFDKLCSEKKHISFEESISFHYPKLASEWYATKNDPLLPEFFRPGSGRKVWWQCPKNLEHIWKASINSRKKGHGCPICAGVVTTESNSLAKLHPKLSKEWHPVKNNELKPTDVSPGTHKKAWWICKKGHEWYSAIRHRSTGVGCPYCSNKKVTKDNCLSKTHPKLSREWHKSKNKDLSPSDVTYGVGRKVWWKCHCGNEWEATISNRARRGDGCPSCRKNKKKDKSQLEMVFKT